MIFVIESTHGEKHCILKRRILIHTTVTTTSSHIIEKSHNLMGTKKTVLIGDILNKSYHNSNKKSISLHCEESQLHQKNRFSNVN